VDDSFGFFYSLNAHGSDTVEKLYQRLYLFLQASVALFGALRKMPWVRVNLSIYCDNPR